MKAKRLTQKVLATITSVLLAFGSFPMLTDSLGMVTTSHAAAEALSAPFSDTVTAPAYNAANIPTKNQNATVQYWMGGNAFYAMNQIQNGAGNGVAMTSIAHTHTDACYVNTSHTAGVSSYEFTDGEGDRALRFSCAECGGYINDYLIDCHCSRHEDKEWSSYAAQQDAQSRAHTHGSTYLNCTKGVTYTPNQGAKYVQWTDPSESGANTYQSKQVTSVDWNKTWELIDTDARWDENYLYGKYCNNGAQTTTAFNADILNTVNNMQSYLSDAEKNAIRSVTVNANETLTSGSNKITGTNTLSNAKLFVPSVAEMYYSGSATKNILTNVRTTDHASSFDSAHPNARGSSAEGVTRSFGGMFNSKAYINSFYLNGSTAQLYFNDTAKEYAITPAFYLDLEKIVMAKKAAAPTIGKTLTGYAPASLGNSVKFLIRDDSYAPSFTTNIGNKSGYVVNGKTYSFTYSNAVTTTVGTLGTGGKKTVSAAIYDSAGKLLYYAPLAEVTKASDTAEITIPSLTAGQTYKLAIFEEQIGGTSTTKSTGNVSITGYETDYQSKGISYTSITALSSDQEFTVSKKTGNDLFCYEIYTKSDMTNFVNAKVGNAIADPSKYFVMKKSDWNNLTSYTKSAVASANTTDVIDLSAYTTEVELAFAYYSSDSASPQVRFLKLDVIPHVLDVKANNVETMLSNSRMYYNRDIGQYVTVTFDETTLDYDEYYFMKKDAFDKLSDSEKTYDYISANALGIKVENENSGDNEKEFYDLPLEFVYFYNNSVMFHKALTLRVANDIIENDVGFDDATWYESTENGITWHYKLNGKGEIIGLYTVDSVANIIDDGQCLNVPARVSGRPVTAIGGGFEDGPFVPKSATAWKSISLPSSVTVINDYAFYKSQADSDIVIPDTITNIGIRAFASSHVQNVKINDMNGTIGSLAFGDASELKNVTLKGGEDGLVISSVAFRESGADSVTIRGNVTLNKNAFKNNMSLDKLYLSGNIVLNEYAFTGCSAVTTLSLSGNVNVGAYAFNNLTSLGNLYIPKGTIVAPYAFNGCKNLINLETEIDLENHFFEGCNKIQTLVLGEEVSKIDYDWEGHCGDYNARYVYVKNKDLAMMFYGDTGTGTYYSCLGSSPTGDVTVYILKANDMGINVTPNDGILTLNGYTCYANSTNDNYILYMVGKAKSVRFVLTNNIKTEMASHGVNTNEDIQVNQTGIEAYYDGMILTTTDINKDSMTVIPVYGSNEGASAYESDDFYIIRTSEFNELEGTEVTEEAVATFEPVKAKDSDLSEGQKTGTISVTVIVFSDDAQKGYFNTPVSIRVEEYSAQAYVEQKYGSYEEIVKKLAEISHQVDDLQAQIDDLEANGRPEDVEKIANLTQQLNDCKEAYDALIEDFAEFIDSTEVDETGYFGTIEEDGEKIPVIYINGIPTTYTDTGETTEDGKKIYAVSYDTDGDGTPEIIKVYVDSEGVHVVNEDGIPTGIVYTDTLAALQRQMTAQIEQIKETLNTCRTGLSNIIAALVEVGYDIDADLSLNEQYQEIVRIINVMARKISTLETQLDAANDSIESYEEALARIYNILTNSTLDKDNISGVNNTLSAIVTKIQKLSNDLAVAQATVTDLHSQLDEAESEKSALAEELKSTQTSLTEAQNALNKANTEKDALVAEYEKALADGDEEAAAALNEQIEKYNETIAELESTQASLKQKEKDIKDAQDAIATLEKALSDKEEEIKSLQAQLDALLDTADGFVMTVETANTLFGLTLSDDANNKEVYEAIQTYVKEKLSADDTIAAIQAVVNSTHTGTDLVADVKEAIATGSKSGGSSGGTSGTGTSKDDAEKISKLSAQVTNLETSNKTLAEEKKNLESKVSSLNNSVSNLSDDNNRLKDQVDNLNRQVSNLSSSQGRSSSSSDNAGIASQLSALMNEVSQLKASATKTNTTATPTTTNVAASGSASTAKTSVLDNKKTIYADADSTKAGSNDKKDDKNGLGTGANEDDELEGSTANAASSANTGASKPKTADSKLSGTKASDQSVVGLGTTQTILMPKNPDGLNSAQKAQGISNVADTVSELKVIKSNGKSDSSITDTTLNNFRKILSYYANNLDRLSGLGYEDIDEISTDPQKAVTLDLIAAGDIKPNKTQESQMTNGKDVTVNSTFEGIENGHMYLIMHESDKREGEYDLVLENAQDNVLNYQLADLSPVGIAEVKVMNVATALSSDTTLVADTMEAQKKGNNLWVVIVLLIIGILTAGGVIVYGLHRSGRLNLPSFHRS